VQVWDWGHGIELSIHVFGFLISNYRGLATLEGLNAYNLNLYGQISLFLDSNLGTSGLCWVSYFGMSNRVVIVCFQKVSRRCGRFLDISLAV